MEIQGWWDDEQESAWKEKSKKKVCWVFITLIYILTTYFNHIQVFSFEIFLHFFEQLNIWHGFFSFYSDL